ncbi:MAG: septation protein IspZ, partial [Steroidobacteraceae bacterium]
LGAANLAVAYQASERTWVDFNVFGLTIATAAFVFIQALWLSRRAAQAVPASDTVR